MGEVSFQADNIGSPSGLDVGNFRTLPSGGSGAISPSDWLRNENGPAHREKTNGGIILDAHENWPEGVGHPDPVGLFYSKSKEVRDQIHTRFFATQHMRIRNRINSGERIFGAPSVSDFLQFAAKRVGAAYGAIEMLAKQHNWSSDMTVYARGLVSLEFYRSRLHMDRNGHQHVYDLAQWRLPYWSMFDYGKSNIDTLDFYYYINYQVKRPNECFLKESCR